MFKRFTVWLSCSCSLLILPLALFTTPAPQALAASNVPASGGNGGPCLSEYGVSYDADTLSSVSSSNDLGYLPAELPAFSFGGFDPVISATACAAQADFGLSYVSLVFTGLPTGQVGWYTVSTMVAGQITQTTLDSSSVYHLYDPSLYLYKVRYTIQPSESFDLPLQVHQPYSVQVQYCQSGVQGPRCSPWSPHVQFSVSTNNGCQSGYVPRLANPYDQVCVMPDEQAQVAYDNSQEDSRIDSGSISGALRCIRGYRWRNAFGGDQACVTPAQRTQVAQDNSLAASRIIAP